MSDFQPEIKGPLQWLLAFCLRFPLVVFLTYGLLIGWGLMVAPFQWNWSWLEQDPVPVDAIPDIGENQQIVFTEWMGRSPQDIEDQVTYPLTSALLGVPGVKTVRSNSFFGFSTIYVIFKEDVEFYWSRSRLLEKLASLPDGTLPNGVSPMLGPDSNALAQVFWYTLEGRDPQGNPVGGWDLHELRSIQDWKVRYELLAADGVAEVSSIGGFVQEYQIDVNPDAMRAHQVTLEQVFNAVRQSNLDVGARNLEINQVEYFIRALGYVKDLSDLENAVVKTNQNVPIYVKDVAHVHLGPAQRRGILDKGGAEVVGGVVAARYGANPQAVITEIKDRIAKLSVGLPQRTLADGTVSKVTIVPFYDRSGLIAETLGTLKTALSHEILITILVVLVMLVDFRSSLLISMLLPIAVLLTLIAMKGFQVDANVVALSGIAIAIGTMVDVGIVIMENIVKHLESNPRNVRLAVFDASSEVGSAVITAVATTVLSFLPIFSMEGAEGKLFKPLAYTKTFALMASILIALTLIPPLAVVFFRLSKKPRLWLEGLWLALAIALFFVHWGLGIGFLIWRTLKWVRLPTKVQTYLPWVLNGLCAILVAGVLTTHWYPLTPQKGFVLNFIFVVVILGGILLFFQCFQWVYPRVLGWALNHRMLFLSLPIALVVLASWIWLGFKPWTQVLPSRVAESGLVQRLNHAFPGLGREFMPPLDEGSYLFMPTISVHAAINESYDYLQKQDIAFGQIPEVEQAVGKIGRADSPMDPAPISMVETVINYHSEYLQDASGTRLNFRFSLQKVDLFRDRAGQPVYAPDGQPYKVKGVYERDESGLLIPDPHGKPFRQWRPALDPDLNPDRQAWPGIRKPDDIWEEIVRYGQIPGSTKASKIQPISNRIVMLQTGMRSPFGIKVYGPDLASIEKAALLMEPWLKAVPAVDAETVLADRIVGKPYLEFHLERSAMARYGISVEEVQRMIEVAIGGVTLTQTVEGRERYPVRVRYQRSLLDSLEGLQSVIIPTPSGAQIPLSQISDLRYTTGPQMIKSEDGQLTAYVTFGAAEGWAEVEVVEAVQAALQHQISASDWPAGVTYKIAGLYENQVRAMSKLKKILPVALFLVFLVLYFQFRSGWVTLIHFSGILVAWSGGFLMIWLYGQDWFLNFQVLGLSMRDLFGVAPINLSVAIWVGFLALFGIATDDGVIIGTYLEQQFDKDQPPSVAAIRQTTIEAGRRRVRPALMTVATTVLALIPVLTSQGRGSDIMKPMAIPTFGGMTIVVITIFVVPVLYSWMKELQLGRSTSRETELI